MDSLEEDLTCSVCFALFSDPRVLPCSHTFCRRCLDGLLQAAAGYSVWRPLRPPLKCPNCRSVTELPPAGIDALPANVSLRAIVEKYQRDSEPRPPSCQEHRRQPLNVYCVQDRQLICGLCLTVGRHHGHPIDDLQAAFVREKQAPSQLLARLSERRWAQVCELAEQLEQERARCEGVVRQDRQEVSQYFQQLEAALAKKRLAYMEALDKAGAEVSRAYDPLIHRVKELQEEQLELVALGSSVEEEASPLLFLEKLHAFRERVEEFMAAPLPSAVRLSVSPRAAHFLLQHWPAVTVGNLEEAPVPEVCCCCCSGCGGGAEDGGNGGRARPGGGVGLQPAPGAALLGVLLLLAALWVHPVGGGASLGFPLLSQLGQLLHGASSDAAAAFWDVAGSAYAAADRWACELSAVGEGALQQLAAIFKTLTSH